MLRIDSACMRAFADQVRVLAFHAASIDSGLAIGSIKIGERVAINVIDTFRVPVIKRSYICIFIRRFLRRYENINL